MTVRDLRLIGDPVLRTPCDPVTRFDDTLARLVEDLLDTVQLPGRAGLAANQIGAGLAVFSYHLDGELGYLINPRLVELAGHATGPEGCLSVPGIAAERERAESAVAVGLNLQREEVVVAGTGELARCLQHETDHLNGELFIDKLSQAERRRVMRTLNAVPLRHLAERCAGSGPRAALRQAQIRAAAGDNGPRAGRTRAHRRAP